LLKVSIVTRSLTLTRSVSVGASRALLEVTIVSVRGIRDVVVSIDSVRITLLLLQIALCIGGCTTAAELVRFARVEIGVQIGVL
jgi:hypothetical protein